jgi:hypothetical protein
MKNNEIIGYMGCLMLCIGVFMPFVSIPIIGDINYFKNGEGDGIFILAFSIISFVFILNNKCKWLWLTGIGSSGLLLYTFFLMRTEMAETKQEMGNNRFAELAIQSIQLEFGWAFLILGCCLLLTSAAMDNDKAKIIKKN